MPNDLHYLFPEGIYLLILIVPIIWIGWRLLKFRDSSLEQIASEKVLKEISVPRSRFNFWMKLICLVVIWFLASLSIMQPVGNGHYLTEKKTEVTRKAHDLIILVDASASMEVKDTRTGVSRFEYAKEIGDEIVSQLKGESVALYAFTSKAMQLSPLTLDYLFVRIMMKQMGINEGDVSGTDFEVVLEEIQSEYFSKIDLKSRTVVILSDGGDTQVEALKGERKNVRIEKILQPLDQADAMHLRVFSVGIGSVEGGAVLGSSHISKLDKNLLEKISEKGRGKFYFSNEMTAVDIAHDITDQVMKEKQYLQKHNIPSMMGKDDLVFDLYFQYPLGMALFLSLFIIGFPDTRRKKMSLLLLIAPFQIDGYYEAGMYDNAIEKYQELEKSNLLDWQRAALEYNIAVSLMMKGELKKSIEELLAIQTTSKQLNRKIKNAIGVAIFWQSSLDENNEDSIFFLREALSETHDPELRKAAKIYLAKALDAHLNNLIKESDPEVGLPVLLSGVQALLLDIEMIKKYPDKKGYVSWILRDMKEWLQLWHFQTIKFPALKDSEIEFKGALKSLNEGDFNESAQQLKTLAVNLKEKISKIFGDDPLIQNLQSILLVYYRTLNQEPLQESGIYQLQLLHKQANQKDQFLDLAAALIQEGKNIEARIYTEQSRQEVRRELERLTNQGDPKSILEQSIQELKHTLSTERLLQKITNPSDQLILFVKQSKEQTIKIADPFWNQVIKTQEEGFSQRCQCQPWNEVLPLYEKGLNQVRASNFELALNDWQDALDLLLGKKSLIEEPKKEDETALKALLQQLQQMEQDDRKERAVEKVEIGGERSW